MTVKSGGYHPQLFRWSAICVAQRAIAAGGNPRRRPSTVTYPLRRAQTIAARTAYLKSHGLRVSRVTNDDLLQSPDAVTEAIMREARKAAPSPQPSPSKREKG